MTGIDISIITSLIGIAGVIIGTLTSWLGSYLTNKQNHENALRLQRQSFQLENRKLYAQKLEELMKELLEIDSLTASISTSYNEGYGEATNSEKNKVVKLRDSSILKARLYFPEIVDVQHSFMLAQSNYISAIENSSNKYINSCAEKYNSAKDNYLRTLSTPLGQNFLLDNP